MTAGFADEAKAIELRLRAGYTALPIDIQEVPFTPPASGAWVALWVIPGSGRKAVTNLRRWVGVIQIDIYQPQGSGTRTALAIADTIGALFDNVQFSAGPRTTITTRTPSVFSQGLAENGRLRTVVTIPFQRDRM